MACIVVAIRYGRRDRYCKCGPADCQNQSYQSLCRRIFLSEQFLYLPCGILRHVIPISRSRFPSGKVCGPNDRVQFLHLAANQAKRRGRQIKMRPDWEDRKLTIMHNLLVHKFNENLELIPKLLDTGGAVLVEGEKILYAGSRAACPKAEQARRIDGRGGILMPGFSLQHHILEDTVTVLISIRILLERIRRNLPLA